MKWCPSAVFCFNAVLFFFFFSSITSVSVFMVQLVIMFSAGVSGKQLVQYTAQPVVVTDPMSTENTGEDLPSLLELDGDSYFSPDPADDPTISLLTTDFQTTMPGDPKL